MDDLYKKGVAGPVVFELTDATYTVKSKRLDFPAWDFTSYIVNSGLNTGTNTVNTITWRPSAARSVTRGSVTINLESGNGKGIVFGQNLDPTNSNAIYKEFQNKASLARKFANSNGYITFDGGPLKALRIVLKSSSNVNGSAIYLGRGTQNVSIKNILIENGTQSLYQNVWLPMTSFTPSNGFYFQEDSLRSQGGSVSGYSAGIVNRSTLMRTEIALAIRPDTVANINNTIEGNEISGFGYGVLSLGLGELLIEKTQEYKRFYNTNNTIKGNLIHDVYRAGIYLGYEENSSVMNNKIYNVGGAGIASAGIMAGGDGPKIIEVIMVKTRVKNKLPRAKSTRVEPSFKPKPV
jgi:parallel beta-helix repeat protein